MSIFDKWNNEIDGAKMAADVKEVEKNGGGEYKEVPKGRYVVKVEKMELKEAKSGAPMVAIQFRILEGEFTKSCLFMNQVVTQPFQISIVNEMLRSMETSVDVGFDGNYEHYNNTILDVFEAADKDKLEFLLAYGERKGYATFKIIEVYGD